MLLKRRSGLAMTGVTGLALGMVVVFLIFAIFFPFVEAAGGPALQQAATDLCKFNAGLKDHDPLDIGRPFIPSPLCFERTRTITADDWKACDPEELIVEPQTGREGLKAWKNKAGAKRVCTSLQVAVLAKACFDMYGGDKWDLNYMESGSHPCFKFKIKHLDKTALIGESEFTEKINLYIRDGLYEIPGYCVAGGFRDSFCEGGAVAKGYCSCGDTNKCAAQPATSECLVQNNILWSGDLFSEQYAKEQIKLWKEVQNGINALKPQIASLQDQLDKLNLDDDKAVREFYNKLLAAYHKYDDYPLSTDYKGSSFLSNIEAFKNSPATYRRHIRVILKTMQEELSKYLDTAVTSIKQYSKGNLMCFDECGGTPGGECIVDGIQPKTSTGTDLVRVNSANCL